MRYLAAVALAVLTLSACPDTNECGTVDLRNVTGPLDIRIDCPGEQDISPGNTFDADATLPGLGLAAAPAPPSSAHS